MLDCPTCGGPIVVVEPKHEGDTGYCYSLDMERRDRDAAEITRLRAKVDRREGMLLNIIAAVESFGPRYVPQTIWRAIQAAKETLNAIGDDNES